MRSGRVVSLRRQMITLMVICWLIPIAAVAAIFGVMLSRSYEKASQQEIENTLDNAFGQLEIRLKTAIEDSKNVSYDGIVRSSYRNYQLSEDAAALYSQVNEYLSQRFARDEKYKAVFISFRNGIDIGSHVVYPTYPEYAVVREYRDGAEPFIMDRMAEEDTAIRFFVYNNELYIARNLLDGKFVPYATLVMQCGRDVLFNSFLNLPRVVITEISIDGEVLKMDSAREPESELNSLNAARLIADHTLEASAVYPKFRLWRDVPSLKYGLLAAAALGIPMLLIAAWVFYRQVTRPTQILLEATEHVTAGERGYQITPVPNNTEFMQLTERFNTMSAELQHQFEQLYQEQQALQQSRIRALQSQINPHFLNNTLEVINWEARMADDEKVSAMIEALSTMLDAALDRDGRGMISLAEELRYVDAYLYIIHERLGDRFRSEKEIEPGAEEISVPRLILQPIVENAVEHDITPRGGGEIRIRVYREAGSVVLVTDHSGMLTEADREKIRDIIEASPADGKDNVGLRNVAQRLKLIYGESSSLAFEESDGRIRMTMRFPIKFVG